MKFLDDAILENQINTNKMNQLDQDFSAPVYCLVNFSNIKSVQFDDFYSSLKCLKHPQNYQNNHNLRRHAVILDE